MRTRCRHVSHVPKTIQIRNVPDALYRRLRAKAALTGMSLSDFLLNEAHVPVAQLTIAQMHARLVQRPPSTLSMTPAAVMRDQRGY